MSAVSSSKEIWSIPEDRGDNKYEKCRNITEEIYKRINITFEIKKLESAGQSDVSEVSDQIDSNELSNETDLFACDKSDSICSSTEADKPAVTCEKYININNNEETGGKKAAVIYKRPRKKFRKRVKKRPSKTRSESEGSSDEALPLSRIIEDAKCVVADPCTLAESPDNVMGVPKIIIFTKDLKPKTHKSEKTSPKLTVQPIKSSKKESQHAKDQKITAIDQKVSVDKSMDAERNTNTFDQEKKDQNNCRSVSLEVKDKGNIDLKGCKLCSLSFRGERGLRRHMSMSHVIKPDESKWCSEQREKTSTDG